MAGVDSFLRCRIRQQLERKEAQLPLLLHRQSIVAPRMYKLVHGIASLIRSPLNQRIALKRLERCFQVVWRPQLLGGEERPPCPVR